MLVLVAPKIREIKATYAFGTVSHSSNYREKMTMTSSGRTPWILLLTGLSSKVVMAHDLALQQIEASIGAQVEKQISDI